MNDIEPILRAALDDRSRTITPETLLRPRLDSRRGRSARWLPAAASAAVVVMIAVVVALFAQSDRTARLPATSGKTPGFVGYVWTVASVHTTGRVIGATSTPPSSRRTGIDPGFSGSSQASIAFDNVGNLYGSDGVNSFSGTYKLTRGGFRARNIASTAVGYVGTDQTVITLQQVFARINSGGEVNAVVVAKTLTLTNAELSITFHRAEVAPTPATSSSADTGSTGSGSHAGSAGSDSYSGSYSPPPASSTLNSGHLSAAVSSPSKP